MREVKMRRGERKGEGYTQMSSREGLNEHCPLTSSKLGKFCHISTFPSFIAIFLMYIKLIQLNHPKTYKEE